MRSFFRLSLILLAAGCAGVPPAGSTPGPSLDLSSSCSGRAPGEAVQYPGWPPAQRFELVPVMVSSELSVGENRVLVNVLDARNQPLASPERDVELRFYDMAADPAEPAITVAGEYMATTPDLPGLYRASGVRFPCWGEWGLEVVTDEPDGSQRTGRMIFPVRPTTTTPAIGAPAPASDTPTAETPAEINAVSTDTQPDADFYRTSVADALSAGRPFLLIFSTPAFCRTRTCGPALDIVKSVAPEFSEDVEFIHVEPYQLELVDGEPRPVLGEQNQPVVVESVLEWGLPTEPYIFVVDADGHVAAKMEGVASADELEQALREVSDGGG